MQCLAPNSFRTKFIIMNDLLTQAKLQITKRIDDLLDGYIQGKLSESDLDELGYLLTTLRQGLKVMEEVAIDPVTPLWRLFV